MNMKTGWHPVALSSAIEAGSSAGATLFGEDIVVWRDTAGAAHVWEDRCPHRGMRLSFGFVRGDHIACLYHGWQYDAGGQCRYIPAHPDLEVPQTIKVPVYGIREYSGMIWTRLDGATDEMPPVVENEGQIVSIHSLYVDRPADAVGTVLDNLEMPEFSAGSTATGLTSPVLFSGFFGGSRLFIGLQTVSADRTGLHIALEGSAEAAPRAQVLHWALDLRHRLEHPPKAMFAAPASHAVAQVP